MAALTASDVTVTLSNRHKWRMPGLPRIVVADLAFGDAADTYPSGGVPLPAKEQFGYSREIVAGFPEQPYANGFFYKYDRTNHKLKIYTQGFVTDAAGSSKIDATGKHYYVENSAGTYTQTPGGILMFAGATAANGTYDIGPMIELPTTVAPAAATVRVLFLGE